MVIGVLCTSVVILFIALFWIIFQSIDSIAEEYMTIKTEEYGNWDGHIDSEGENIESGLYIFPEQIDMAKDSQYYYYCSNHNSSLSEYLIYAEVTYTKEDYLKEQERISNIKCEVKLSPEEGEITNNVLYSEELFMYPAYIAIYASNLSYEYALLNEKEQKIIYIYSQLKDANNILPTEYLPLECQGMDMYEKNSWNNTNIYFGKDKNGDYSYFMDR